MGGGRRPRARNLAPRKDREFYAEATRGRSASHHLQVKAALALLYRVLGSPNPFSYCQAPKFSPEKTELRYHTASQLGELHEDKESYFGHLTYHLASALFFTDCRYHEWALLTLDRLVREPGGVIIAVRLQVKGGSFRDLPLTKEPTCATCSWAIRVSQRPRATLMWIPSGCARSSETSACTRSFLFP